MVKEDRSKWTPGCGCFALVLILPVAFVVVLAWLAPRIGLGSGEFGFLGASIVLAVFVVGVLVVLASPVLGLIWAPFAAWLCARAARARRLDSRKFAVAGAVYSILLFWPWVYLILRIRGKRVPGRAVHVVYIILYSIVWPASGLTIMFATLGSSRWFVMVCLALVLCNVVTWFISHRRLAGWHRRHGRSMPNEADEVLPNRAYIMPFAYTLGWVLVAATAWALGNAGIGL